MHSHIYHHYHIRSTWPDDIIVILCVHFYDVEALVGRLKWGACIMENQREAIFIQEISARKRGPVNSEERDKVKAHDGFLVT